MTSLLYYSISSGLTHDEILEIDDKVANNRKEVYLFLKRLVLNSKNKAEKLKSYIYIVIALWLARQPLIFTEKEESISTFITPTAISYTQVSVH